MKNKKDGNEYSLYEKIILTALLIFFLSMLFMFFVIPRL
jgi:hypothetical protein